MVARPENEIVGGRRYHPAGAMQKAKDKLLIQARGLQFWIRYGVTLWGESHWNYHIPKYKKAMARYLAAVDAEEKSNGLD